MTKTRMKVPETASAGDVITIKVLANHLMESGHRVGGDGKLIPRKIINKFDFYFNDNVVFGCDIGTGVAANPFFEFRMKIQESGVCKFIWTDDDGSITEAVEFIEVV